MEEKDVTRFVELSKQIHEHESKNTVKNLQLKKEQLKDLSQTVAQLEDHYKKATADVAKEKADVDRMKEPSTRDFFKDQKSFDEKMSVEMEEYLEAVSKQEIAKKQLEGVSQQQKQLEQEVAESGKLVESVMKLYDEQDEILGKIFNGAYGSDLENKLEAEVDALLERKERIKFAKYKWCNAKILLEHAVKQLGVACGKWQDINKTQNCQAKYCMATDVRNHVIAAGQNVTSAQRYLNNIKFPYCEPAEIQTLNRACENIYIDMQTPARHEHAYKCYYVTYRRCAALKQWFDSVINDTITKDLEKAKKELVPKEKALREERMRLIREKLGNQADGIVLQDTGQRLWVDRLRQRRKDFDDDEEEPELMQVAEPDKVEGSGNSLTVDETAPKAPTPLPLNELAPPPSQDELFGNIEQLKQQHEKEMAEFEKAQETNKARMEQGLQEKLAARRNRRTRISAD